MRCEPTSSKWAMYAERLPEDVKMVMITKFTKRPDVAKNKVYLAWLTSRKRPPKSCPTKGLT